MSLFELVKKKGKKLQEKYKNDENEPVKKYLVDPDADCPYCYGSGFMFGGYICPCHIGIDGEEAELFAGLAKAFNDSHGPDGKEVEKALVDLFKKTGWAETVEEVELIMGHDTEEVH